MFDDFELAVADLDDVSIRYRVGGSGPPLLLIHGFPQNHMMWNQVAPMLAERFTVVAADLRGYGGSSTPQTTPDHAPFSKRTMALDQVKLMAKLGFEQFAVAGHDRGARCSYRLAMDHPDVVTKLAILDIIPTLEAYDRADRRFGMVYWHWFFLPQPAPMPEAALAGDVETGWMARSCRASNAEAFADFMAGWKKPSVLHGMVEDYRAGATIDYEHDKADFGKVRIQCPTLLLWGSQSPVGMWYDVVDVWRNWCVEVHGRSLDCSHFLAEEKPEDTAAELIAFFS
jgi:haloacetate dehalogenase